MNFQAYVDCFNSGDEDRLGKLFFTPDIIFDGGNRRYDGRESFVRYLKEVVEGMRQVMVPVMLVSSAAQIMAELDITFIANEDRPDFPFGPLGKGDSMTFRFFGSYYLKGDRIARIHLANWPSPIARKGAGA